VDYQWDEDTCDNCPNSW